MSTSSEIRPKGMSEETPVVVDAEHLTKTFRLYPSARSRLAELLLRVPRHRTFHALSDVSFRLDRGKSLALIGENGAGKSTLLKIVAGVMSPTSGKVALSGRLASILELGAGFHPDLTGRQNIRLNAAMMGLSEAEIVSRSPEIVSWSELGEFIDQPVRQYSSGMTVRLAFSIASQVSPDVLLIDEALSVGDGYFQKKCMDRILGFVEDGGTLLFCSHSMYYVSAFCERALWLRDGKVEAYGATDEVVADYGHYLLGKANRAHEGALASAPEHGGATGPARVTSVAIAGVTGETPTFRPGQPLSIEVEWEAESSELAFHLGIEIMREDNVSVTSFATHYDEVPAFTGQRRYHATLDLPRLPFNNGKFGLHVYLLDGEGLHIFDQKMLRTAFAAIAPRFVFGFVDVEHRWRP